MCCVTFDAIMTDKGEFERDSKINKITGVDILKQWQEIKSLTSIYDQSSVNAGEVSHVELKYCCMQDFNPTAQVNSKKNIIFCIKM